MAKLPMTPDHMARQVDMGPNGPQKTKGESKEGLKREPPQKPVDWDNVEEKED